jgi:hypothetical protein
MGIFDWNRPGRAPAIYLVAAVLIAVLGRLLGVW